MTELIRLFLRLGITAFGGPAAHIAMLHDEVVVIVLQALLKLGRRPCSSFRPKGRPHPLTPQPPLPIIVKGAIGKKNPVF